MIIGEVITIWKNATAKEMPSGDFHRTRSAEEIARRRGTARSTQKSVRRLIEQFPAFALLRRVVDGAFAVHVDGIESRVVEMKEITARVDHVELRGEHQRRLLTVVHRVDVAAEFEQTFEQRAILIVVRRRAEAVKERIFVRADHRAARGTGVLQQIEHRHVAVADRVVNPKGAEVRSSVKSEILRSKSRGFLRVVQIRFFLHEKRRHRQISRPSSGHQRRFDGDRFVAEVIFQNVSRTFVHVGAVIEENLRHFNGQTVVVDLLGGEVHGREIAQRRLKRLKIRPIGMRIVLQEETNDRRETVLNGEQQGGVAEFVDFQAQIKSIGLDETQKFRSITFVNGGTKRRAIIFQRVRKKTFGQFLHGEEANEVDLSVEINVL